MSQELACDTLIVGAGISGLACAYWLKKHEPQHKVLIIDQVHIAYGASGRNAGFLTCGSINYFGSLVEDFGLKKALSIWRFCEENHRLLQEHVIGNDIRLDYRQAGSLTLSTKQEAAEELLKTAQLMIEQNLAVDILSSKKIEAEHKLKDFSDGAIYKKDGSIYNLALLKKIEGLSEAPILEQDSFQSIMDNKPKQLTIKTRQHKIQCHKLIFATNGYSQEVLPYFKNKVSPIRAQCLETEPVESFLKPNVYVTDQLSYFRQTKQGTLIVGGKRTVDEANEVGTEDITNPKIQAALDEFIFRHISKDIKIKRRWSGVMGYSSSGLPEIGTVPEHKNVYFLGGYSGHGMGMAFHTAKKLCDFINQVSNSELFD